MKFFYSETTQSVILASRNGRHKPFIGYEDELRAEKRIWPVTYAKTVNRMHKLKKKKQAYHYEI